jgi:hypothetical protein
LDAGRADRSAPSGRLGYHSRMFKIYGRLAAQSVRLALRGWPAAVALLVYAIVFQLSEGLLGQLGMVGGFITGFVIAFLISSYLHLLSLVVAGRPIRLADFRESFGARFWDVVSVLFALWIIELGVGVLTSGAGERGQIVMVLVGLAMAVFFNPVPELIYLGEGRVRSFALLGAAARFISAHWPEWLGPSALFAAAILVPSGLMQGGPFAARLLSMQALFSMQGLVVTVLVIPNWLKPIMLIFITWAMVFRGLLFVELATGRSRRMRQWTA